MNIGIDLGGSHIAVGLVDENANIIMKKEHNWTKEEKANLIDNIKKYCIQYIKEIIELNPTVIIEKIGIGYPSKDILDGIIYINNQEFNLADIIYKEFNIQVFIKNDAKCSGICENKIGSLKEYKNSIFMTLGTGIGGAFFYEDKLVVPTKHQGFEIGHMVIKADGKQCRCGKKGCFEEYASMRTFRGEIEELFNIEDLKSYQMFEIIKNKEKEEQVNEIIDRFVTYLAIGISNLIAIFEPDAICIGGSFSYYAPIFMDKLKEKIQKNFIYREIPDILIAKFENDAGIIGASMI